MAAAPEVATAAAPAASGDPIASATMEEAKLKAKATVAAGAAGDAGAATQNGVASASRASPTAGDTPSRKRSRSGSRILSANGTSVGRSKEDGEKALLDIYGSRQQAWEADAWDRDLITGMNAAQIRQTVPRMPIGRRSFLDGWRTEDNSIADTLRPQWMPWIFPVQRRARRRGKHFFVSRKDQSIQAEQIDELVPIRLDIEYDKYRLRDTFTWNIHDRSIPLEKFAELLVEDFGLPMPQHAPLAHQVHMSMQDQITDFHPHLFFDEEPLDPHLPYSAYKNDDMRVNIRLNITIGPHTLVDQFEWELNNPINLPEEFAAQMTRDLGLSGEFTTSIAHAIREQCQLFTRSLYVVGHPFDGRPVEDHELASNFCPTPLPSSFRHVQASKDFSPYLYELNDAELEKTELALSREERRQKRSVNRRGGPTLPDLKDRRQTNRTLIVSSILPGAVDSLEESRIYKRSLLPKRKAPRDFEESEESESEDSGTESPAVSHVAMGTARTRGMRGAAAHAQAAMRSAMNRSATPESAIFHEHETRKSGRKVIRDEMSSPSPSVGGGDRPSLMIKLRVPRQKFQALMRNLRARAKDGTPGRGESSTPRPATAANRTPGGGAGSGTLGSPATPSGAAAAKPGLLGRVEAKGPPGPEFPMPPPPPALLRALSTLRTRYPQDRFEATMRYTAVHPTTDEPITLQPGMAPPPGTRYAYYPRIRCSDCPGKLYTPDSNLGVDNFEVHLRNRHHRDRVAQRIEGAAADGSANAGAAGASGGAGAGPGAGSPEAKPDDGAGPGLASGPGIATEAGAGAGDGGGAAMEEGELEG